MSASRSLSMAKVSLSAITLAVLTGCASVSFEQNLARVNDEASDFAGGQLSLARNADERKQRADDATRLLGSPLGQKEAVQLALVNSHALQVLLAQGWAESAAAAQGGRIANPVFSYERLVSGDELEITRALSFGLLDILTLPARQGIAERRIEQSQLKLTGEVLDQVTKVRQAWVRAVAAQQKLTYAQQVYEAAEAGAELARRMQSAGNFNRLNRAREQAFYGDAAARLAAASHEVTSSREEIARLLGLDESQTRMVKLPARLPDLPKQALEPAAVGAMASKARLDIRLAQSALQAAGKAQGLGNLTSFTDIELTALRGTKTDSAAGTRTDSRGYEIGLRLPIFDWGGMPRDAWSARTLAAANQYEATVRAAGSSLRESYSAYRTAYDIARQYRDEIVLVRKVISDENQLRYNGMIIGVFELLADARDQVNTVTSAINAEQQFWLADAALQSSLMGRPMNAPLTVTTSAPSGGSAGH